MNLKELAGSFTLLAALIAGTAAGWASASFLGVILGAIVGGLIGIGFCFLLLDFMLERIGVDVAQLITLSLLVFIGPACSGVLSGWLTHLMLG